MSSIFESIDREVNQTLKFWNALDELHIQDSTERKIHESPLLFLMPNGSWKTRNVILTSTRIYYTSKDSKKPKKMAVIIWKKLEPFTEESEQEERFGFRLIQAGIYQDFYTKTPDQLEEWLDKLSRVVILNDIEDDYIMIREIGSGNYAKVHLAQDIQEHKEFAVKSIDKEAILTSTRSVSALISEIGVMRKLNHPNLITLYRVYENQKSVHLILDYVPGGDLFHRIIERNKFTEETAAKFMKNLMEVLTYMHSMNIVHRDLKPENILMTNLDNDWEFKIADFGLACESKDEQVLRCGSPGYVAPEILKKKTYGKKVDIFSAGIILYVLLSSRAPFYGKTANEILLRNKECKIYFQDKYWKTVSKEGIDFVLALTDSDPESRPTSAEALKHRWLYLNHNSTIKTESLAVPEKETSHSNIGISSELMRRFNKNREESSPSMAKMKRDEVEEKISQAAKANALKIAKNVRAKLMDADSALH